MDRALRRFFPRSVPAPLARAMRYSLFTPGKKLRPAIALWSCEALGGRPGDALPAACALEMIHTYSLVHDDLPAMDDDDMRRGKPSNHKAFGEATAILVGDALQAAAFETIARQTADPRIASRLVLELAVASGPAGMVGGQQLDLAQRADVREIHRRKTAALIRAAALMGALCARARPAPLARLGRYGETLGLAFQIVDDILDRFGSAQELGKTPGKDDRQGKKTYPAVFGLARARKQAEAYVRTALAAVDFLGARGERLRLVANWILTRKH